MQKMIVALFIASVASAGGDDLLICHCDPGATSDVETYIAGDPLYDIVDFVDCRSTTPSLDTLENYGCVFTWSNYAYADPTAMGDNLADYVDSAGSVVICNFAWTSGWGLYGRIMTDANYAPITHQGSSAYTSTNLGDYDEHHEFMDDVSSISGIYHWTYVNKESPATWVADNSSGYILCAVNADYTVAGVNMYPGDYHYWTGDGWTLFNNVIQSFMYFIQDYTPPHVDGMDPDDGETDVPVDSTIVFHCKDDFSGVDVDTIDFTARDTTLSGGRVVSSSPSVSTPASPARVLAGDLEIDDTDPLDVVCTWTGDDPFYGDVTITCTVAAGLSDIRGNEMEEDFVWSFTTEDVPQVETATWGAIKAGF
jgi:hypothetical protein